jgi:hypothetical protein
VGIGDRRSFPVGGGIWCGDDCRCSGVWSEAEREGSSPDRSCNLAWNEIAPFCSYFSISPFFYCWRLLLGRGGSTGGSCPWILKNSVFQ